MRKLLLFGLLGILLFCLLPGCGSDDSGSRKPGEVVPPGRIRRPADADKAAKNRDVKKD